MATIEPTAQPKEKVDEPWKPPQRPGKLGVDYDELGAEMAPNARVWKKYVEETDRMDKELVEGWNSSLDIILIFAALFSAISTAFVIESSKDLKPDYSQATAQTLQLVSQTLSAIAKGSPLNDSDPTVAEAQEFSPSSSAVAVNALWFLSLGLSVAVSLIAILAKEWCHSFMAGRVGSMMRQARLRQQRWDGIERWKMKEILYVLPLLMHTALCESSRSIQYRIPIDHATILGVFFAVGLSLYLWDINVRVALPVVVTTSLAGLFYVVTVSLPLFFRFCPYTTALARFLYPYWLGLLGNRHTMDFIGALVASFEWMSHSWIRIKYIVNQRVHPVAQDPGRDGDLEATGISQLSIPPFSFRDKTEDIYDTIQRWVESMRAMFSTDRSQLVEKDTPMDNVTCSIVTWMVVNCEDSRSVDMALQALAGADHSLPRLPLWECGTVDILCQRIADCINAFALMRSVGLQVANDTLLDDASLYSRSLNFLTTYIAGEGLDMIEELNPHFTAKDDPNLATRLQNTAQHARDYVCYQLDEILKHAWNQPTPRYELVAYELNVVPAKASVVLWNIMEGYRDQCQKQQELVQSITSGRVSSLPSGAMVALINGITKTYLYDPLQSPKLLLDLLGFLRAQSNPDPKCIIPLAIGLAVVGLRVGSYRGNKEEILTDEVRLKLARDAYTILAAKTPNPRHLQTLLRFGLLALLDHKTQGVWTFNAAEVELIRSILAGSYMIDSYHAVLPDILPASFGFSNHLEEILHRVLEDILPDQELEPDSKSISPVLLRMEALLGQPECHAGLYQVVPLLTQHFSSTDSPQQRMLCLRGIKYTLRDSSDLQDSVLVSLLQTGLLTRVLEVTISRHNDLTLTPYCMEFLWVVGQALLRQANKEDLETRLVSRSLLDSLDNPFQRSSPEDRLPENCDEIGLANLWLLKIDEICHNDPESILDSNLLSAMIEFYESEEYSDIKPRTTELPSAFDSTWTWLQILRYWEKSCKEAIENKAKDSAQPGEPTRTIRSVERHAGEGGSCLDKHDWSI